MSARTLLTALRQPHARARIQLLRDVTPFVRLHFLSSAHQTGILDFLHKQPASIAEIAEALDVRRPELLDTLLALGISLKELRLQGDRYDVRGSRAKALLAGDGDALAAMIEELTTYHASVYQQLGATLRGAPLGDYLDDTGALIARSSRVLEPFVHEFVKTVVRKAGPVRMLEIGCGSGVYLRYAAAANTQLTGVAVDLRDEVVTAAAGNLAAWGIAGRFDLKAADIRKPPADLTGPFDLITLYNNIYYFDPDEWPALFRRFRDWLAPGGTFALVSMMHGTSLGALDFDLTCRSTVGLSPLPRAEDVIAQLKASGFSRTRLMKLVPGESFYGIAAT